MARLGEYTGVGPSMVFGSSLRDMQYIVTSAVYSECCFAFRQPLRKSLVAPVIFYARALFCC